MANTGRKDCPEEPLCGIMCRLAMSWQILLGAYIPMTTSRRSTNESIYQLKVTLRGIKPPIWRRVQVSSGTTLSKFHQILQTAMGWTNSHLYQFEVEGRIFGDPDPDWGIDIKNSRRTKLSQVVKGEKTKFSYVYDMGDNWEHELMVEKIMSPDPSEPYPICVTGKRACPPEDCGGTWGYEELLEIISDPNHEEYEERMEWLGEEFDPESFDVERVNRVLNRIR